MGAFDSGAAGFAEGFIQALQRKEDREDRLKETSEDRALRKLSLKMSAAEHGYDLTEDPTGNITGYTVNPDFQRKQNALHSQDKSLGLIQAGFLPPKIDDSGMIDMSTVGKPNREYLDLKAKEKLAGSPYATTLDQRQAFQAHQKNIQNLKKDPVLIKRLNQYQNLDNALSMITQAHEVTPQQIHEFQQTVRNNMGISGTGGVGEREETYFKTAGLNAAAWKQFLTGDPVSIARDSKLMDHLRNLAAVEQANIKKQYGARIKAVTGGNASMYANHPEYQADLDDLIESYGGQVGSGGLLSAPSSSSAPNKGDVVDGYRFKGGDPSDPDNWEEQ